MQSFTTIFSSAPGLMTAAGMLFMLGMGVFFIGYFIKHIREDGKRAATRDA
jgi:hypothetical protein